MLLSLLQTHICKSMILVRTVAILFICKFGIRAQNKENIQEIAFIHLVCQIMIQKLIFNYD